MFSTLSNNSLNIFSLDIFSVAFVAASAGACAGGGGGGGGDGGGATGFGLVLGSSGISSSISLGFSDGNETIAFVLGLGGVAGSGGIYVGTMTFKAVLTPIAFNDSLALFLFSGVFSFIPALVLIES